MSLQSESSHPLLSRADGIAANATDTLLLVGRVLLGWLFLASAWAKLGNIAGFAAYLKNLKVPAPEFWSWIGALVELEPGIEGLIHVSQLAPQRVWRVRDVVKEGQAVEVVVLDVDRERQRISLSLKEAQKKDAPKAAEPEPEEEAPAAPAKPPKPRTTPLRGGTGSGGPLFPELPSRGG